MSDALLGEIISGWRGAKAPSRTPFKGQYCKVLPLEIERDFVGLFEAFSEDVEAKNWTYLPYGPFATAREFRDWLIRACAGNDPFFYTILSPENKPIGIFALMRIDDEGGSIEIGHIHFSPQIQRTRMASEALFMVMDQVFKWGYRRLEWKCNRLNEASNLSAQRIGFTFEGTFRQHRVVKGRNRDTNWYSILDSEWPQLRESFLSWLNPQNFDSAGQQKRSLKSLRSMNPNLNQTSP
jgi:RimJ/RimL family protein N-acetyltransferase